MRGPLRRRLLPRAPGWAGPRWSAAPLGGNQETCSAAQLDALLYFRFCPVESPSVPFSRETWGPSGVGAGPRGQGPRTGSGNWRPQEVREAYSDSLPDQTLHCPRRGSGPCGSAVTGTTPQSECGRRAGNQGAGRQAGGAGAAGLPWGGHSPAQRVGSGPLAASLLGSRPPLSPQRQHGGQLQQAVPVLRPGGQLHLLQRVLQPQRRLLPAHVRRWVPPPTLRPCVRAPAEPRDPAPREGEAGEGAYPAARPGAAGATGTVHTDRVAGGHVRAVSVCPRVCLHCPQKVNVL